MTFTKYQRIIGFVLICIICIVITAVVYILSLQHHHVEILRDKVSESLMILPNVVPDNIVVIPSPDIKLKDSQPSLLENGLIPDLYGFEDINLKADDAIAGLEDVSSEKIEVDTSEVSDSDSDSSVEPLILQPAVENNARQIKVEELEQEETDEEVKETETENPEDDSDADDEIISVKLFNETVPPAVHETVSFIEEPNNDLSIGSEPETIRKNVTADKETEIYVAAIDPDLEDENDIKNEIKGTILVADTIEDNILEIESINDASKDPTEDLNLLDQQVDEYEGGLNPSTDEQTSLSDSGSDANNLNDKINLNFEEKNNIVESYIEEGEVSNGVQLEHGGKCKCDEEAEVVNNETISSLIPEVVVVDFEEQAAENNGFVSNTETEESVHEEIAHSAADTVTVDINKGESDLEIGETEMVNGTAEAEEQTEPGNTYCDTVELVKFEKDETTDERTESKNYDSDSDDAVNQSDTEATEHANLDDQVTMTSEQEQSDIVTEAEAIKLSLCAEEVNGINNSTDETETETEISKQEPLDLLESELHSEIEDKDNEEISDNIDNRYTVSGVHISYIEERKRFIGTFIVEDADDKNFNEKSVKLYRKIFFVVKNMDKMVELLTNPDEYFDKFVRSLKYSLSEDQDNHNNNVLIGYMKGSSTNIDYVSALKKMKRSGFLPFYENLSKREAMKWSADHEDVIFMIIPQDANGMNAVLDEYKFYNATPFNTTRQLDNKTEVQVQLENVSNSDFKGKDSVDLNKMKITNVFKFPGLFGLYLSFGGNSHNINPQNLGSEGEFSRFISSTYKSKRVRKSAFDGTEVIYSVSNEDDFDITEFLTNLVANDKKALQNYIRPGSFLRSRNYGCILITSSDESKLDQFKI